MSRTPAAHRRPSRRDLLARRPGVVAIVAVAGTLVACGSPDAVDEPSPSPPPATTSVPATPTPEPTTTPATGPEPTPGDITPPGSSKPPADPSGPPTDLPPEVLPSPQQAPPGQDMTPPLQEVVNAASADLAGRLDVERGSIEVLLARPETFPDGALGCRREGEMYSQAVVDGYRVILQRGERVWLYTAAEGDEPSLCPSEQPDGGPGFVPPPGFDE